MGDARVKGKTRRGENFGGRKSFSYRRCFRPPNDVRSFINVWFPILRSANINYSHSLD